MTNLRDAGLSCLAAIDCIDELLKLAENNNCDFDDDMKESIKKLAELRSAIEQMSFLKDVKIIDA